MSYRFFFSYSSETLRRSRKSDGTGNWLEDFFTNLCDRVGLIGSGKIEIAYRDNKMRVAEKWETELVNGLQDSAVLVAVLSPQYFESSNCGREFAFFRERLAQLGDQGGGQHRIIPVCWVGEPYWDEMMQPHVRKFMGGIQLTQNGFPEDYRKRGLLRCYTENKDAVETVIGGLADRILDLGKLPPLPKLASDNLFTALRSFFETPDGAGSERIAQGPLGTNVVYAVATREMMGEGAADNYAEKAEEWRPFRDTPTLTVGPATQVAIMKARQKDYSTILLRDDLLATIKKAGESKSIVLVVLDEASLRCEAIKKPLADYDGRDTTHVGLVGIGSKEDEQQLKEVFPVKYESARAHHLWTVPPQSTSFEESQ